MKIGILTFHNIPNIGAILQAYSLCIVFRNRNVECDIIDYTCMNIRKRELSCLPHRGDSLKDIVSKIIAWPKNRRKIRMCQDFMKKQGMYSCKKYTPENLKDLNKDYDVLVSGSDMIWNLDVTDYDWTYFLDFADDHIIKVSYGSSIGGVWSKDDLQRIKKLLSKYTQISTRENDTNEIIQEFGLNSRVVSDPTMLLTSDYWSSMTFVPKEKDYVIVYFPSEENLLAANRYAEKHHKQVLLMNWSVGYRGYKKISPNSPIEWLSYIKYADAVFTNSYHGMLFSIYFSVPFWVGNYGNRITSILNNFNLNHRMIKNDMDLDSKIDFENVSKLLNRYRFESLDYVESINKGFNRK